MQSGQRELLRLIVLLGINLNTHKEVAIKLERIYKNPSLLEAEFEVYQSLAGGVGIPRVYDYLFECEYNVMVFDLLGPSLKDLFNFCGRRFSLKTVLMLVDQLLHRLEHIHSKNIIHRDVKPDNFLMGTGRCGNQVYVTDMGLATEHRDVQIKTNSTDVTKRHLIGTARFASINGHLGIREYLSTVHSVHLLNIIPVQDRCDDLESLGYMLLYFLRGSLPWQGLRIRDQTQREKLILEKKKMISSKELCKDLPNEFALYFDHVRSLGFGETPAYDYLRKICRDLFVRKGYDYDHVFDWTILKYLMSTQCRKIM